MAWNMLRIKANVEGREFDKDEVIKAANAIQAIANSGMGALYLPGTDKGTGWEASRAKPGAAIIFYVRIRKQNLAKPMITGWKEGEGDSASGGGILPFSVALLCALAAIYGASGAWMPPSLPPAAAETPS